MQSLLVRESPLLFQILHHVVLLSFNSQVQTCLSISVPVKLVLSKSWKKVFHNIKAAVISSKV